MSIDIVLIVDDSEIDQFLARYMIEKFDTEIEIFQAYDGREALDLLHNMNRPPNVIFLDINMPRMNGHEFLDEYDTFDEQTANVIMLTSSEQGNDMEQAMAHDCVKQYFTKPLDKVELEAIIQ